MSDERMEWAEAKAIMEFGVKFTTSLCVNGAANPYTKEEIEALVKRVLKEALKNKKG